MQNKVANVTTRQTEWNSIDWKKHNRIVKNLRYRIFRASKEKDLKKVRSLQKLMMRSYANRVTSVRRMTQINRGKHTAGVDRVIVKTPTARGQLIDSLSKVTPWKAKPVRRVYIPKADKKLRPLGIPVIFDRCLQTMVKNALEPYWEAKFESTSYGFRPGRSCHDAIEKIFGFLRSNAGKKQWILDADIHGAFNEINHEHLLKIIGGVPGRELIKQWLKAGYMEKEDFHPTTIGAPQGGSLSPLLMNIVLHGMEEALTEKRYTKKSKKPVKCGTIKRPCIRYADDFVVLCETREDAQKCKDILQEWLRPKGLRLSEEKTQIVHISKGFDFLGFNIRQYQTKSRRSGKKLIIKPSKTSIKKLRKKLKDEWISLRGRSPTEVAGKLNPIIRGWANYFKTSCASRTFRTLDCWMFKRETRYVKHRHPKKPRYWTRPRYWGQFNKEREDRWVFGDKETGVYLLPFRWFAIRRHILVKGNSSPDDPSLKQYWAKRHQKKFDNLKPTKKELAKRQHGFCPNCAESLLNGEELHIHHIVPKKNGGSDEFNNLCLLHYYCHQQQHCVEKRTLRGSILGGNHAA